MNAYDVVIIGAGQAGVPLARRLAKCGRRVAIIERSHLGGSCVNFGCTPTKAVVASARVAHVARRAAEFGVVVPSVSIDFPKVLGRARAMVDESKRSLAKGLAECGADVIDGKARFNGKDDDAFRLSVGGTRVLLATTVVVNVGTRTQLPPIDGLTNVPFLHAGNWLEGNALPSHVVFVGAGVIALEMAQFYRRMGSRVTVVGHAAHVAGHEDPDVASALQKILEDEGVEFQLGSSVASVAATVEGVRLTVGDGATIDASHIFIATGRKPNTDDLGLETIGLAPRDDGMIEVDDRLASRVPGVWVAGDVRGGPMFTHASWDDHRVLESQLLGDGSRTITDRIVPYAIFTDPELGHVGMTEADAQKHHGDDVKVATFEMKQNGKASEQGEITGFIKLIANRKTHRLLGAAVLAVDGAELVGNYVTLMNANATLAVICEGIYIHPTLTEAVQSAVMALDLDAGPA